MAGKQTLKDQEAALWQLAAEAGDFTYARLMGAPGATYDKVRAFVADWEERGLVKLKDVAKDKTLTFIVIDPAGPELVRDRIGPADIYDNMWVAMRILRDFTPTDLVANGSTEEIEVTTSAASAYCRQLCGHGYLKVLRRANPGRREARYRLVRNTGRTAPRPRRVQGLFDANTAEFHHQVGRAS